MNKEKKTPEKMPEYIKEEALAYGKEQGMFTLEDYYTLPDDYRVELIDGVFYDMAAPGLSHQGVSMSLSNKFYNFISKKKGPCRVFSAPVDVQLDCDNRTMVQPDIMILCDMKKFTERCIMGAPDFVVEILSESTKKKDSTIKLEKYRSAGVREYWMIDLKKERIIVHSFEKQEDPVIYGFESIVPVGIYEGDLMVDFKELKEDLVIK